MSDDQVLDQAARIIADARVECLKFGASPQEIGEIMMDEATLGLMAESVSMSEIQKAFQKILEDPPCQILHRHQKVLETIGPLRPDASSASLASSLSSGKRHFRGPLPYTAPSSQL